VIRYQVMYITIGSQSSSRSSRTCIYTMYDRTALARRQHNQVQGSEWCTSRCSSGCASASTAGGSSADSSTAGAMARQSTRTAEPVSSCRCLVTEPSLSSSSRHSGCSRDSGAALCSASCVQTSESVSLGLFWSLVGGASTRHIASLHFPTSCTCSLPSQTMLLRACHCCCGLWIGEAARAATCRRGRHDKHLPDWVC